MIPIAAPDVGEVARERVDEVLADGHLADGPEVRAFEDEFADFCDVAHGVATSNGTTALHTALASLGIGAGDRVLTSPFSFVASANAARHCGAEVGFVDIDPGTYALDPDLLEARLRDGGPVDAVVAVHLYGLPAAVDRLAELADEYDFALVEDACQAHGAAVDGDRVGGLADAACFSFYPTKNMTTAEGGMVTTDDPAVAERARRFVDHGRTGDGHAAAAYNFRMTSVAAAIGRAQLDRLPAFTEARRRNARDLTDRLADLPVVTPTEPDGRRHVYHQYTIRHEDRDALRDHLAEEDVGAAIYYPTPIHREPAYDDVDASAPEAERAAEEVLSLPVHPGLDDGDVERIAAAVRRFVTDDRRADGASAPNEFAHVTEGNR